MSNDLLKLINKALLAVETAKEEDLNEVKYFADAASSLISYYEAVLDRANKILDRDKVNIFIDVLNLRTRGEVERAMLAYDMDYLLSLNLSVEATAELTQNLIQIAKRFNLPVPSVWKEVAKSNSDIGKIKTDLKHVRQVIDI